MVQLGVQLPHNKFYWHIKYLYSSSKFKRFDSCSHLLPWRTLWSWKCDSNRKWWFCLFCLKNICKLFINYWFYCMFDFTDFKLVYLVGNLIRNFQYELGNKKGWMHRIRLVVFCSKWASISTSLWIFDCVFWFFLRWC